ncbi:glycosyltransferase family 39 protein [Amycolatopsis endophytica]|uniref:4-amino-4-deoxy-L-arabinose transferase-like glycosyltransferase n=1 Tax=Amycolatopsis endophytica TaxID=860233 RepID=A0A853AVV3_9PSEU|nr:glycosyltransferase family 39 protein [Amycolatopsis endophytica]NYI86775.1 4-amino-4-deoxy-L-arabinose transferase-like glycosyltransferase [Amycolatopsis endophytica]
MTSVLTEPARTGPRHRAGEPAGSPPRGRLNRLLRGPENQPAWVRPAVLALLAATAVLYFWNLTASGYGNGFYAAAVQAGTQDPKAWLFGSLDSGNSITVDKPPAALWVAVAFARVFGFSSFTVLAPQALMGVASVGALYATVKRTSGPVVALFAGAAFALTPVAVLMFRFNNPDALLVLLLIAGAYCTARATEKASGKWLALAGVAIGFAFLTKMMQAFLVLPAFALVYLVGADTPLRRRLLHLLGALVAVVASAGWFVALVEIWPASSRPYIGGSTTDSLLELALGYNGLGRIFGGDGNMGGGGGGGTGFGGDTGIFRMFNTSFGTEISWLLPAAVIGLGAGLWFTRRAPRSDRTRLSLLLWGGWLVVTATVFSFMSGTVHPYYSVALAPAIAALSAIAGRALWRGRANFSARAVLAGMVAVTAVWTYILLARTPDYLPWLKFVVVALGLVVSTGLLVGATQFKRISAVVVTAAVLVFGLGGAAYAVSTGSVAHTGSTPSSGPSSSAMGGTGGMDGSASSELTTALSRTTTKWAAAVSGSQQAASLELATGKAVIAIGGWDGSDDSPTLEQFQDSVAAGEIGYYVSGTGMGGGMGGDGSAGEIQEWVEATFTATTIGGTTVYVLS